MAPVLRSAKIANKTDRNLEECQLRLVANPPFVRSKTWVIDRILSGDEINLTDRKVELDSAYLAGLNEAERGEITITLTSRAEMLAEVYLPVRLLARDEWGGVSDMAQLLPAFVMPNDPAVGKVLRNDPVALAR